MIRNDSQSPDRILLHFLRTPDKRRKEKASRPKQKKWAGTGAYLMLPLDRLLERDLQWDGKDDPSIPLQVREEIEKAIRDFRLDCRKAILNKTKEEAQPIIPPVPLDAKGNPIISPSIEGKIQACEMCGRYGVFHDRRERYCSPYCSASRKKLTRRIRYLKQADEYRQKQQSQMAAEKPTSGIETVCPICGKKFIAPDKRFRYCGASCARQAKIASAKKFREKKSSE